MLTVGSTFARPPYSWEVDRIGAFILSGFVGAIAAYFVAGRLVDYISARMTRPGESIRPESRLPAIVVPALIGPMGLILYAKCIAERTVWVGPAFGFGMQAFGFTAVSNIAIVYAVDQFKPVCSVDRIEKIQS